MSLVTRLELDLRPMNPSMREGGLLSAFDELPVGGTVLLRSREDLRPLYDALLAQRPGIAGWYPLEGREEQKAEVIRLIPKDLETGIHDFYGRDHDEIDTLLGFLRRDLERAATGAGPLLPSALATFEEFDRRLSLHIRWEESILFPSVEGKHPHLADGPGAVMRLEHCKIHHFKGQAGAILRSGDAAPGRAAEALRFIDHMIDVLVPHNHKEESIYYPLSEQVFSAEEKAMVLACTREMK